MVRFGRILLLADDPRRALSLYIERGIIKWKGNSRRHELRCGAVRCGAVRCGAVRCGAVRCGAVRGCDAAGGFGRRSFPGAIERGTINVQHAYIFFSSHGYTKGYASRAAEGGHSSRGYSFLHPWSMMDKIIVTWALRGCVLILCRMLR